MLVELPLDPLLRRLDDRLADLPVKLAEIHVHLGRGALDDAERADDRGRLLLPADLEILERTLRLRAPIAVRGNFDRAEGVGLDPGRALAGRTHRALVLALILVCPRPL